MYSICVGSLYSVCQEKKGVERRLDVFGVGPEWLVVVAYLKEEKREVKELELFCGFGGRGGGGGRGIAKKLLQRLVVG